MDHYFSKNPKSRLRKTEITFLARGQNFYCETASSTFSTSGLDNGTEALIEHAVVKSGERVLDLGCGWGAVGIVCARLGCIVTMTDINVRAVRVAQDNAKRNNVNVKAVIGDRYEKAEGFFDVVLLNPPHTAGRELCYLMIEEAPSHLVTGGTLQIVARHRKGGQMLAKKMEEVFGNSAILGRLNGFTVYLAKKMDESHIDSTEQSD